MLRYVWYRDLCGKIIITTRPMYRDTYHVVTSVSRYTSFRDFCIAIRIRDRSIANISQYYVAQWCIRPDMIYVKPHNLFSHIAQDAMIAILRLGVMYRLCILRAFVTSKLTQTFSWPWLYVHACQTRHLWTMAYLQSSVDFAYQRALASEATADHVTTGGVITRQLACIPSSFWTNTARNH